MVGNLFVVKLICGEINIDKATFHELKFSLSLRYKWDLKGISWGKISLCINSREAFLSFCRFILLAKTGYPCTALAFSLCRKNEILVASGDCSLRCYDTGKYYEQVNNSFDKILIKNGITFACIL